MKLGLIQSTTIFSFQIINNMEIKFGEKQNENSMKVINNLTTSVPSSFNLIRSTCNTKTKVLRKDFFRNNKGRIFEKRKNYERFETQNHFFRVTTDIFQITPILLFSLCCFIQYKQLYSLELRCAYDYL